VVLEVASPLQPRRIRFFAAGRAVLERRVEDSWEVVPLQGETNGDGALSVRFTGVRSEGTALRLASVAVVQEAGRIPRGRLVLYLLFGPAWVLLGWRVRPGHRTGAVSLAAALCVLAAAMHFARLPATMLFPWLVLALGLPAAWLLVADAIAFSTPVPLSAARWVAAAAVFQLALVANLRFGMIDAPWHMRNLWTFRAHGLTVSTAPGLDAVPYPPAFYAALAPLATGRPEIDLRLVRLGMALVQAAAPLLVFALMRAGGASAAAAAAATIAAAVMPEALLVLAKGIACNIFGAFVGSLVVLALLRGAATAIVAGLLAIACLSHGGAAAALVLLVSFWWLEEYRRAALDRRILLWRLLALAAAAAFAWLVYYREVPLAFAPTGTHINPAIGEVRWYRVGKMVQDLALKFGLLPVFLAVVGLTRAQVPDTLRSLLTAWFLATLALAVVAVLSPFPLRFEYFVLPAVAMAAGLGAAHLMRTGHRGTVFDVVWAVTFAVQILLGALLLWDRFEIISVILESPRWPFPFRW
jgi:hypothetical protein